MFKRLCFLLSVCVVLAMPGQSVSAGHIGNTLVAYDRTEPDIAVDPGHPNIIDVVSNTNYDAPVHGTYPDGAFASADGGRSFDHGNAPVVEPWSTEADPSISFAQSGTAFFAYLAETPSYCSGGGAAIILSRSFDHGRTFGDPVVIDSNTNDDKPFSAVESEPGRQAHVFVTWTRQIGGHSEAIMYSRSTNGGGSFSRPAQLYLSRGNNFGSVPIVAPHHRVYVVWSSYPEVGLQAYGKVTIWVRVSRDDGAHFGPLHAVTVGSPSLPLMAMPGDLRNQTFPAAAVTSSGDLFVAWSRLTRRLGNGAGYADIVASRSTDGGATWSAPVRLNDKRTGDRFMPAIVATGPHSIAAAFYDRRAGPWRLDVYAASLSFDHGARVSPNVRITAGSSPVGDIIYYKPGHSACFYPGRFFGDYIGVAMSNGNLCVVWADTQKHVYGRTDIWFARLATPVATSRAS